MCKVGVPLQFPGSLRWGYRGSAAFSGLIYWGSSSHTQYVRVHRLFSRHRSNTVGTLLRIRGAHVPIITEYLLCH